MVAFIFLILGLFPVTTPILTVAFLIALILVGTDVTAGNSVEVDSKDALVVIIMLNIPTITSLPTTTTSTSTTSLFFLILANRI